MIDQYTDLWLTIKDIKDPRWSDLLGFSVQGEFFLSYSFLRITFIPDIKKYFSSSHNSECGEVACDGRTSRGFDE
jgi:hypothetical protein